MERAARQCLIAALLLLLDHAASAQQTHFFRVGGTLSLAPVVPAHMEPITSILWRLDDNLVGEWVEDKLKLFFYPRFANRSQLDERTARLEIESVTVNDSGLYRVDINFNQEIGMFQVTMLRGLTKPSIRKAPLTCSDSSEFCVLTCEGSVTEAGEVSYRWRADEGDWLKQEQKMTITKKDHKTKEFFCQMENQVSTSQSDGFANPFHEKHWWQIFIKVVFAFLGCVLLVCVLVGFCKRKAIGEGFASFRERRDAAKPRVNRGDGDDSLKVQLSGVKTESEDARQPQNQ